VYLIKPRSYLWPS